jgi:hypothetical protein
VRGAIDRMLAADTARHCAAVMAPDTRIDSTASGGADVMISCTATANAASDKPSATSSARIIGRAGSSRNSQRRRGALS